GARARFSLPATSRNGKDWGLAGTAFRASASEGCRRAQPDAAHPAIAFEGGCVWALGYAWRPVHPIEGLRTAGGPAWVEKCRAGRRPAIDQLGSVLFFPLSASAIHRSFPRRSFAMTFRSLRVALAVFLLGMATLAGAAAAAPKKPAPGGSEP